jgi:uroporphyrinogen-III decarboxylase
MNSRERFNLTVNHKQPDRFNTVHNIQANVPVENIVAMIDAVKEFSAK